MNKIIGLSVVSILMLSVLSVTAFAGGCGCGSWVCGEWSNCEYNPYWHDYFQNQWCHFENCPWIGNWNWQKCESCTPDWSCSEWSSCVEGLQTRACSDLNSCGTTSGIPGETQSCTIPEPEPEPKSASVTSKPLVCPDGCPLVPEKGDPKNTCKMNTNVMSVCRPGHEDYDPDRCVYQPKRPFAICWADTETSYIESWLQDYGDYDILRTKDTAVGGWKFVWATLDTTPTAQTGKMVNINILQPFGFEDKITV